MLPVALALKAAALKAAASRATSAATPKLPLEKKLMWGTAFAVVAIVGGVIVRKAVKKFLDARQEKNQDEAVFKDPNPPTEAQRAKAIEQANTIYKALHENDYFGFSEDEEKVLETAKQITHWQSVYNAYAKKFKKNLANDVRKYLDDKEYATFMRYANR